MAGMVIGFLSGAKAASTPFNKALVNNKSHRHIVMLVILGLSITGLSICLWIQHPMWWLFAGMLAAILIIQVSHKPLLLILDNIIEKAHVVEMVFIGIMFGLTIVIMAFCIGKIQSAYTIQGKYCHYINVSKIISLKNMCNANVLKYLGCNGDCYFLLSEDNLKLYIVKSSEIPVLELQRMIPENKDDTSRNDSKESKTNDDNQTKGGIPGS